MLELRGAARFQARVEHGAISSGGRIGARQMRGAPRRKLFLPTMMRLDGEPVRVHLLDLSCSGAQVHRAAPPAVGTTIQIDCGGQLRSARVVRRQGDRFGVQFLIPLSEAQVEAAVTRREA